MIRYHKMTDAVKKPYLTACDKLLDITQYKDMQDDITTARKVVQQRTAWRIDGTLREFPKFSAVNLWFDYPVHHVDNIGILKDVDAEGEKAPWQRAMEKRKPKDAKKRIETWP